MEELVIVYTFIWGQSVPGGLSLITSYKWAYFAKQGGMGGDRVVILHGFLKCLINYTV